MHTVFRPAGPADFEAIRLFLSRLGWAERVADKERFPQMLQNTDRTVFGRDGYQVVGFARDGVSNGYISMVAVERRRRR